MIFESVMVMDPDPAISRNRLSLLATLETLFIQLDLHGVAASQGSACSSGALEPSRILISMGLSQTLARSSLRFSLSRFTTEKEIDYAINLLVALVPKLLS